MFSPSKLYVSNSVLAGKKGCQTDGSVWSKIKTLWRVLRIAELGFGTGIWEGMGRRFSARKIKLGSCCNLHMVWFKCSPKHPSIGNLLVPRTVTLGDHRTLKRWSLPRHAWVIGELPSEIVSGCDCVKAASLDRSASLSASISSGSFFRKDYSCGLLQTKFFCLTYQL